MAWTIECLKKMSPTDRAQLYVNALRAESKGGEALAQLIRKSGLSLTDGKGMTREDPIVQGMKEVINSDEGRAACRKAAEEGHPALAGVDPILRKAFAADYGKHNQTTDWAGHLVADAMRAIGYKKQNKQGKMPDGCVAKTGELWERPQTAFCE